MIGADLRYALRRLARNPGFSALVIVTLALGIGANSAIFSVVDSVLLRPLPYRDPDRLVTIEHRYPSLDLDAPVSPVGFRDYRDRTRSFERVAVEAGWGANLTGAGEPVRVAAARVSAGWFEISGVVPALGRTFQPGRRRPRQASGRRGLERLLADAPRLEPGRARQHAVAQRRGLSGGGSDAGRVPQLPRAQDRALDSARAHREDYAQGATNEWLNCIARLAPGVTLAQAQDEMRALAETAKRERPDDYPVSWTLRVTRLHDQATGAARSAVLLLLGAVGFVLLIACANVANLLLARGAGRGREVAIRMAMGASRARLLRQMLVEATVLALAGGVLGAVLAWGGLAALGRSFDPANLLGRSIEMDASVLAFTLALALLTGVGFGIAPALQVAGSAMQETLHEGGRAGIAGRGGSVLRRVFVTAEFALALTLLAGAGLLIKSFARVQAVDPGFDPSHLLTANVMLPPASYPDAAAQGAFFDRAIERIAAAPGVRAVGVTSVLPFGGGWTTGAFSIEGYTPAPDEQAPWGDLRVVSPGFASAMRIPVLRGRFFEARDDAQAPAVVVIDEQTVKRYFAGADPIGTRSRSTPRPTPSRSGGP
jgi:putative ABC transport system permease protein